MPTRVDKDSARSPRPSTTTMGGSKRRDKGRQFQEKNGRKHHSYDPEKAPYPVSYDRDVLTLQSLNRFLVSDFKGTCSFVELPDGAPSTCLDLGCGTGEWIVDAAKEWPNCRFVGFDLVDIQLPLQLVDKSIAERVTWVHGNFLTTKLPFDDDEFDLVHIDSIARGVPENKWNSLFEEIHRILRPGGSIEVLEFDIIFPILPTWFTEPMRSTECQTRSRISSDGDSHVSSLSGPKHEYALLESLYKSVFENKFINLKPTAVLPIYFSSYFQKTVSSPIIAFPMPPLSPFLPLPPPGWSGSANSSKLLSMPLSPIEFPDTTTEDGNEQTEPDPRSFFSSASSRLESAHADPPLRNSSSAISPTPRAFERNVRDSSPGPSTPTPMQRSGRFVLQNDASSTTSMGQSNLLIPMDKLSKYSERTLAMHLYHAYMSVLACQEPMWEELRDLLVNRKSQLEAFGWHLSEMDNENNDPIAQNRVEFEKMLETYTSDMQARVALWYSLTDIGWSLPPREPVGKAEYMEEERLRRASMEARTKLDDEDELSQICRSMRVIIGMKA